MGTIIKDCLNNCHTWMCSLNDVFVCIACAILRTVMKLNFNICVVLATLLLGCSKSYVIERANKLKEDW